MAGNISVAEASNTLFVGNLSFDTTEDTLRAKFEGCTSCRLPMNEDGRPKGFAFVVFDSIEAAKESHQANLQSELDGRTIRIDYSTPKSSGGGRGGGFGGRGGGFGGRGGGFGGRGGRGGRGGGGGGGGDGCFKCGESGHMSRECPKGGGGGGGGSGGACFNCGESGHFSRECPTGGRGGGGRGRGGRGGNSPRISIGGGDSNKRTKFEDSD